VIRTGQVDDGTLLFAVHPSIQANSIAEFVAYAKQNPGKLNGGTPDVAIALDEC